MFHRFSRPHGRLPCEFELNRSTTANFRSVFGKPHKTRLSDVFFGSKRVFFPTEFAFSITGRPSTLNWATIL